MVKGREFHSILRGIFGSDIKGLNESSQLRINCPKCQEREDLYDVDGKYNLEVNTEKRLFHCWKCDTPPFKGSLGKLIRMCGNRSDYELYKTYAGSFIYNHENDDDEDIEYHPVVELPKEYISFRNIDVSDPQHFLAYTYMTLDRKISKDILYKFNVGFCIEGYFGGRIIIPSYDKNGEINYFIARSYDDKKTKPPYQNPKLDKDKIIFNEGMINWDSPITIVEGSFELLSYPINTIPQLGKTLSKALLNVIKEKKPHIIIVLDPDAYRNSIAMFQLLNALYGNERNKIKIVKLDGEYDLDELRRHFGQQKVIEVMRSARELNDDDYSMLDKHLYEQERKREEEFVKSNRYNKWKNYHN